MRRLCGQYPPAVSECVEPGGAERVAGVVEQLDELVRGRGVAGGQAAPKSVHPEPDTLRVERLDRPDYMVALLTGGGVRHALLQALTELSQAVKRGRSMVCRHGCIMLH